MSIVTLEGVVENGQIRLKNNVRLPENTTVYVIVPGAEIQGIARISSPRLAHPEQSVDFKMQVVDESSNAKL